MKSSLFERIYSVYKSQCFSVCNLSTSEKPAFHSTGNFWSKNVLLILTCLFTFLHFICLDFLCVLKLFWAHIGGVSRARVCGCGCWHYWQVTGNTWHMHVTHDMWHMTHDTWFHLKPISLSICFAQFDIDATISTHQEIQCLLYAEFFCWQTEKII